MTMDMHFTGPLPRPRIVGAMKKLTLQVLILAVLMLTEGHAQDRCLDCTPAGKPNMKCAILDTKTCKSRPPGIFDESRPGYYPGSPRDLKVDTYLKYNQGDKTLYPVVNISFKGPDDASLIFVKGFEVTLRIMSGERAGELAICRLFDLSAANITNDDVVTGSQTEFSYKGCFNRLKAQTTYWVRVRSLPEPTTTASSAKDDAVYIDTPAPTAPVIDSRNSANWEFYIKTIIDKNQLKVSFSKPPDEFKFTQFRVVLVKYTTNGEGEKFPKLVAEQEVYNSPVVFKVQCPGLYRVWVEPIDTYLLKRNRCLCKQDGQCVGMCVISRTRSPINITKGSPSCPGATLPTTPNTTGTTNVTKTKPTHRPDLNITLIILGVSIPVTGSLIVIILVLAFVFCRRRKKSGIPRTSLLKSISLSMLNVTKKTLLILYYADNPAHKNVVFLFANFLSSHCSMVVTLHDRCAIEIGSKGKDNWVVGKFETVDWIVIINSKGAFEQSRNNMNVIQTEAHILDDMFSCAITMLDRFSDKLTNKCISVYFPYTDTMKLIRQFTPKGIHYELMTNIESFCLRVHGMEKYDAEGHEIECKPTYNINIKEYHRTELGRKLREAIDMIMNSENCDKCLVSKSADLLVCEPKEPIDTLLPVEGALFDERQLQPTEEGNQLKQLDSGVESCFTIPPSGSWENINLMAVFDDDSDGLADPGGTCWSSESSIGSTAQADFEQFDRERLRNAPASAAAEVHAR